GLHHGLANALCLPAVVEWNESAAGERLGRIAGIFGAYRSAAALAEALRTLRAATGLPAGLASAGVRREMLASLADKAFEDACHRLNPRPCTRDDLLELYRASM